MNDYLLSKAQKTVEILKRKNKTIATAESCTGGMVSQYLTAVAGSSVVFELGICSYSSRIKNRILGVNSKTLEKYGAVSRHTAAEMASRVKVLANSDLAVSVTGVAGPEPSEGKTPGTVYIALSSDNGIKVEKLMIDENIGRNGVRETATEAIFDMICAYFDKEN